MFVLLSTSTVNVLLCPPGDADWSLGPGWASKRANEQARERASVREREREDRRRNRSKTERVLQTPTDDAGTDQNPLTRTHTLTLLRGPTLEEERQKLGAWGSEVRGQGRWLSFLFLSVAWNDKKTTVWTNYKDDWTPDQPTDGETDRKAGRTDHLPPSQQFKEKVTRVSELKTCKWAKFTWD